jgi:hypothetical protein
MLKAAVPALIRAPDLTALGLGAVHLAVDDEAGLGRGHRGWIESADHGGRVLEEEWDPPAGSAPCRGRLVEGVPLDHVLFAIGVPGTDQGGEGAELDVDLSGRGLEGYVFHAVSFASFLQRSSTS